MCDEVLVVLRGRVETLDVFSGDMTDCIPAVLASLQQCCKKTFLSVSHCTEVPRYFLKFLHNYYLVNISVIKHIQAQNITVRISEG